MFNPYFSQPQEALTLLQSPSRNPLEELRKSMGALDEDRLLLLLLIIVLLKEGQQEAHWPLVGALIYCLM